MKKKKSKIDFEEVIEHCRQQDKERRILTIEILEDLIIKAMKSK